MTIMSLLTSYLCCQYGTSQFRSLIGRAHLLVEEGVGKGMGGRMGGVIVIAPSPHWVRYLLHQLIQFTPSHFIKDSFFFHPSISFYVLCHSARSFQSSLCLWVAKGFYWQRQNGSTLILTTFTILISLPLPFPLFIFSFSHYWWSQQTANTHLMDSLSNLTPNQTPLFSLHSCLSPPLILSTSLGALPSSNLMSYKISWNKDKDKIKGDGI